jgi:hypothetical protein
MSLRPMLNFFVDVGMYDVLVPFILIFGLSAWFLIKKFIKEQKVEIKVLLIWLFLICSYVCAFLVIAISNLIGVLTRISSGLLKYGVIIIIGILIFLAYKKENPKGKKKTKICPIMAT